MFEKIDRFLDGITMYKVLMYGLFAIATWAVILGFLGILPFKGYQYVISLGILLLVSWVSNTIFSKLMRIPQNTESAIITGLILFCLLSPFEAVADLWIYSGAAVFSMASKYIIAFYRKHLFNPAALTAVFLGLLGSPLVSWWVGSVVMLPVVSIVGILILRKIRRFFMFFYFVGTSVITIAIFGTMNGLPLVDVLSQVLVSWPIVFFGTVMLTEPLTTPPRHTFRIIYSVIVGLLFGSQFHVGPVFSTPELALVIGNIFSYAVSSKQKLLLLLQERKEIAKDMYEFTFIPKGNFSFLPGQYMEWTLDHPGIDTRGNRRYFTVSSSPTEKTLNLGVKIIDTGSSFKKYMLSMKEQTTILAGQLAGDFTLPSDKKKKLVFLAGGIGITPFRSILKYLIDTNEKRDIISFYAVKDPSEIVYKDIFDTAEKKLGIQTIYTVTDKELIGQNWKGKIGRIDEVMIKENVKDYKERTYYISGPQPMVQAYKQLLKNLGIAKKNIVVDYFPGFV